MKRNFIRAAIGLGVATAATACLTLVSPAAAQAASWKTHSGPYDTGISCHYAQNYYSQYYGWQDSRCEYYSTPRGYMLQYWA